MSGAAYDVVVIGAGANGLAAAAVLARAGRRVLLLEREGDLGGQGRLIEFAPGFRAAPLGLDAGWLPDPVARAIGVNGLEHAPYGGSASVAIAPGSFLTLPLDPARAAEAIAPHSAGDASKWPAFAALVHRLAGFLSELYKTPAPDVATSSPGELVPLLDLGRKFRGLGRRDMIEFLRTLPLSAWELAEDRFELAPLRALIASAGIQDHRQGPRSGGTGFVLLHYRVGAPLGAIRGRMPWGSGPGAFTETAERAARSAGVAIRTGAEVARIDVHEDAVSGVVLRDGEAIGARTVLSTANPARTLLEWVDPVWLDPEFLHAVGNIRHRGCTAVVLYALDALPELPGAARDALAGVVSLTPDVVAMEKAADAAKYGDLSEDPHVEITAPTWIWPKLAPEGKHVLAARAQYAPHRLRGGASWDDPRREALADRVTAKIDSFLPGFRGRVLHRAAFTPADLEARFGLREGAPSHGELGLDQILFMRPVPGWGRHDTPIRGLYLGGAGSHPGPGVLGGPGWLAARRILAERNR